MTKFKGLILNVCSTNLIICPKNTSVCSRLVIRKPYIRNVCPIVLGCIRSAAVLSAQWFSDKADLIWYKWVQCVSVLLFSPLFFSEEKNFRPVIDHPKCHHKHSKYQFKCLFTHPTLSLSCLIAIDEVTLFFRQCNFHTLNAWKDLQIHISRPIVFS